MRLKRTHTCGDLRAGHAGQDAILCGWVASWRDHGGLIFIDVRDRYGLTQVAFSPERAAEAHKIAAGLRSEYVIAVRGTVNVRPEGTVTRAWRPARSSSTPLRSRCSTNRRLRLSRSKTGRTPRRKFG